MVIYLYIETYWPLVRFQKTVGEPGEFATDVYTIFYKVRPKICDLNVENEGERGVNAVKKQTTLKKIPNCYG